MIKEWVKECVENSGMSADDIIRYCDVTQEDLDMILCGGDYSAHVADNIVSRLGVLCNGEEAMNMGARIPHIELRHGMVLFRKDSETQCRFLTVTSNSIVKVEQLSPNCYSIDMKSPY